MRATDTAGTSATSAGGHDRRRDDDTTPRGVRIGAATIAEALGGRRSGDGWAARCPAHDDETPSLSLRDGDRGPLVTCHAGCTRAAVIAALRGRGLWPASRPRAARASSTRYVIRDLDGTPVAIHIRQDRPTHKHMWWEQPDGTRGLGGRRAADLPLYGCERLASAAPDASAVVVEGEKAADALHGLGVLALGTVTGATGTPSDDVLRVLAGRDVVLWPDDDEPGRQHMARIARRLRLVGVRARILEWPGATEPGDDAADYVARGGTREELGALLAAAATPPSRSEGGGGQPSQATALLEMLADLELWHAPDGEAYATLERDGHRETHALRSRAMRDYLSWRYYTAHRRPLRGESRGEALDVLEARARYEGEEHRVWLRVGEHADAIYLDLGDPTWRAVEVTPDGWRIVTAPPVRFRRAATTLALPEPVRGGTLEPLRRLVRVESDDDWHQLVGWELAALRPRGPYPLLALGGEPGAAKTTTARILRSLIDPSVAPVRSEPREMRDLIVTAKNGWVVALDNLSHVQPWLSDALCRLLTGGGYSARELYSDLDEVVVDVQRPAVVTAVEDVCTRSDLADRAIVVTLPAMPETGRRPERELWAEVDRVRPAVLGALLDAVVRGLRELPSVRLDRLPRMADYATWIQACEPALGVPRGTMVAAYTRGRQSMTATTIEASPVGTALLAWLARRPKGWTWGGTAAELLAAIAEPVPETTRRDRQRWPQSPRGLSGALRRLAPALRSVGVLVDWRREAGTGGRRVMTVATVATDAPPAAQGAEGDGRGDGRDGTGDRPSHPRGAPGAHCDDGDGRDGSAAHSDGGVDL